MSKHITKLTLVFAALLLCAWTLGVGAREPETLTPMVSRVQSDGTVLSGWVGEPHVGSSEVILKQDTGLLRSYDAHAENGYAVATLLRGSDLQYPLTVTGIQVYLYRWNASVDGTVDLRAQVHAAEGGTPGTVLATSAIETASLLTSRATLVELALVPPLLIETPQAFFASIHFQSGALGTTPGVLMDMSEVPHEICYYMAAPGVWTEHYDWWAEPSQQGYAMIRARATTSGGPSDCSEQLAVADTFLASERDEWGSADQPGEQSYFLVGNNNTGGVGNLRTLVRFGDLVPPIAGARPQSATLRLYHFEELQDAIALTLSAYRVTMPWDEVTANWTNMAANYADVYGSAIVPAQGENPTLDHLISLDVTELVQDWFDGVVPNHGIMLIGGEDVPGSQKHFHSRQAGTLVEDAQKPLLIVEWDLPEPTPQGTAGPTDTPTLTPTATRTLNPFPSETPTPTHTFTPTGTYTPSPTTTVTLTAMASTTPTLTSVPSVTPTPGESVTPPAGAYLPLIVRG